MVDLAGPYRRDALSASVPCGADPSAADSSDANPELRGGLSTHEWAASPRGHAYADRITNEISNGGAAVDRPKSNRNRTRPSSSSWTRNGSSSAVVMAVVWCEVSGVAAVTCGEWGRVEEIPTLRSETCDEILTEMVDVSYGAAASEVAVSGPVRAAETVTKGADASGAATEIQAVGDVSVTEELECVYVAVEENAVNDYGFADRRAARSGFRRARFLSCWDHPRYTSF